MYQMFQGSKYFMYPHFVRPTNKSFHEGSLENWRREWDFDPSLPVKTYDVLCLSNLHFGNSPLKRSVPSVYLAPITISIHDLDMKRVF